MVERAKSQAKSKQQDEPQQPLLYRRAYSAKLLSVSLPTIVRLEKAGKLDVVKPAGERGQVFHKRRQVHALAGDEG